MLEKIKSLLFEDGGGARKPDGIIKDVKLAEATLMFHVIAADGKVTDDEVARMKSVLAERHGLDKAAQDELFDAAREADNEAVDLYRFTSLLTREFDRDERIAMIERLWEVVFADDELHELEDNVVWRVAKLLHVEAPDRIAMKQRVRDRQLARRGS